MDQVPRFKPCLLNSYLDCKCNSVVVCVSAC
jgi:hypothetical protein